MKKDEAAKQLQLLHKKFQNIGILLYIEKETTYCKQCSFLPLNGVIKLKYDLFSVKVSDSCPINDIRWSYKNKETCNGMLTDLQTYVLYVLNTG